MNLFSNKKAFFLRVVNVILLLWLLIALIYCCVGIVNLLMPEPLETYKEYQSVSCRYFDDTWSEAKKAQACQDQYESYKVSLKNKAYYNKRSLAIAISNILIVGTALVLINKIKED